MKRTRDEDSSNGFEAWGGYMNAKITKLEEQYKKDSNAISDASKISNIFEGISIFVNGHSEPPAEVLRHVMMQHGGTFNAYQTSNTTHVIASTLPNSKLQQKSFSKVIRPEWIIDSVAAGKVLATSEYLLCSRPALQPALQFKPTNSDQKAPAKTATDSNFISEFYNNSRLHHLSTMGALLKEYVGKLKQSHEGHFPGIERLRSTLSSNARTDIGSNRVIMHIDMDSFFVSVALRDRPDLIGRPVAVTHAKGNSVPVRAGVDRSAELAIYQARMGGQVNSRFADKGGNAHGVRESMSEVASCSYEARSQGVKNGMYLGRALSLCPGLVTVPYDFAAYTEVSYALYDTVAEYTLNVEAVSCDEMFIDCTNLLKATGASPLEFATSLRSDVSTRTRCPCSTGLGGNKLQARLAARKAKPNGQYYVSPIDVDDFMRDIRVKDLPGVGWSTMNRLREMDVETCLDLQGIPLESLKSQLGGKTGETLYRFCRGIDDRPVVSEHQRKSVSAEVNYGIRFTNSSEAEDFLKRLSTEVAERLASLSMRGQCLTLKLMTRSADAPTESAKFLGHGVCDSASRSAMLTVATADPDVIAQNVLKLNSQFGVAPEEMRGIGIQMTKLVGKSKAGSIQSFLAKQGTSDDNSKRATRSRPEPEETVSRPPPNSAKAVKIEQVVNKQSSVTTATATETNQLPPISDLDPDVLKELPEEIRQELLRQYGATSFSLQRPSTSKAPDVERGSIGISHKGPDLALQKPSTSRDTGIPDITSRGPIGTASKGPDLSETTSRDSTDSEKSSNLFAGLPSRELRNVVTAWVESEPKPQPYDIRMLANHSASLVFSRKIEMVDQLLSCLCRIVRKHHSGDGEWLSAYRTIVDHVQEAMVKVYLHPLRVGSL